MRTDQRLRAMRKERAFTRQELAARARLSINTVARAERGEPINPGTIRALATALRVPVRDLLVDDDLVADDDLEGATA